MGRITLLLADNEPTRLGMRMALRGEADICAEAENAEQAIRAAKREQPEVCLVGRSITGDGIQATRGICRAAPKAAVVLIADEIDTDDLLDAVRAGAVGYIAARDLHAAGLRRIVRAAADSEAVVPRATS
jgi:DNA-binding NarL/FixJ family response regulator